MVLGKRKRENKGIIYLYRNAETGEAVYVGQTCQLLNNRDSQHYSNSKTSFDRSYVNRDMYTLETLDEQSFSTTIELHEWLDEKEIEYIERYGTVIHGFNSTTGGSINSIIALKQAAAISSLRTFNEKYMPAFERYALKNGNLRYIPQKYVDENNVNLGQLTNDIRTKHTQVPPECHDRLIELGFVMDFQEAEKYRIWKEEYMPAFERFALKNGNLRYIPYKYVDENNVKLGKLTNRIRRKTYTSSSRIS